MAKTDAATILKNQPRDSDGLYVLAEASLRLGDYRDAVNAAQLALYNEPDSPNALRIWSEGLAKFSEDQLHGDQLGETSEEDEQVVAQCIEIIRQEHKASVPLFQYRLRLGYSRAARILSILEARGYVGPGLGPEPRPIL